MTPLGLPAACDLCGLPYAEFGLDATLPNNQWELLACGAPLLLCANCIARRAATLPGAIALRVVIDFAPAPKLPAGFLEWQKALDPDSDAARWTWEAQLDPYWHEQDAALAPVAAPTASTGSGDA